MTGIKTIKYDLPNRTAVGTFVSISGRETTHTFKNLTPDMVEMWKNGMYIQDAMPHLTPDERELFISGMGKEEWDELMSGEEMF